MTLPPYIYIYIFIYLFIYLHLLSLFKIFVFNLSSTYCTFPYSTNFNSVPVITNVYLYTDLHKKGSFCYSAVTNVISNI